MSRLGTRLMFLLKGFWTAGVCIASASLGTAEDHPVLLTQFGKQYVYDQKTSLELLDGVMQLVRDEVNNAKRKGGRYEFAKSDLFGALYGSLLGLANCGHGNDVKRSLYTLQDEFGGLDVPAFCSLGDERETYWKSFVVLEKGTGDRLTPDSLQAGFNLYRLVQQVEKSITKRAGDTFDDYQGKEY